MNFEFRKSLFFSKENVVCSAKTVNFVKFRFEVFADVENGIDSNQHNVFVCTKVDWSGKAIRSKVLEVSRF